MIASRVLLALGLAAGLFGSLVVLGQEEEKSKKEHTILTSADLKWKEGPDALPSGAKAVVLEGSPKTEDLFHLRLRFPAGYKIPPHWHPGTERVTVISGSAKLGLGDRFDESKMKPLQAGSFFSLPPRTAHFVTVTEDTVIQLSTIGPWDVKYVDPADDPRLKAK
jgi:quercetin dioxygenase-like cupin family protein